MEICTTIISKINISLLRPSSEQFKKIAGPIQTYI
jgi:hypothetical protein